MPRKMERVILRSLHQKIKIKKVMTKRRKRKKKRMKIVKVN